MSLNPFDYLFTFILLLAILITASACATPKPPPPTLIPCATSVPDEPEWALSTLSPDADIYTKARASLAELEQRIAYQLQLSAALKSCN